MLPFFIEHIGVILLIVTVIGGYWSSELFLSAVGGAEASGASRGGLHAFRLLAAAVIAVALGRGEVAVGVICGACLAALALGVPVMVLTLPPAAPVTTRTSAPIMLLPVALLFLAGFNGTLDLFHAGALIVLGAAIWISSPDSENSDRVQRVRMKGIAALVLALAMMTVAGWAGVMSLDELRRRVATSDLRTLGSVMLAPAIVLPMVGMCSELAQRKLHVVAVDAVRTFVTMTLCLTLPLVIGLTEISRGVSLKPQAALFLPPLAWRLDVVLIAILGATTGLFARRIFGRIEAVVVIVIYAAYLAITSVFSRQ